MLILLAALTPLGVFAVMQARLDVMVQRHVGGAASAFAAAESALAHAGAEIRLDPSFDRLLAGPDAQLGTSDDGAFPFLKSPFLPTEPGFSYELRIAPQSTTMVDVIATATGPGRATHALALSVVRDRALLPAALTTTATRAMLDVGVDFRLAGSDRSGSDPAQPGLGVVDDTIARQLCADIAPDAAMRIGGAGGTPSIAAVVAPSVENLAGSFASRRTADIGPVLDGAIGSGIAVSSGSLDVGTANGAGVLVVGGNLRVTGDLSFDGLVLVVGDVLFEGGSTVHIQGGLLQGRGNGVLALLGLGAITYDSAVIAQIDTDFPGLLPHRARITGWRDLS